MGTTHGTASTRWIFRRARTMRAVETITTATMATNVNLCNCKAKRDHSTNVSKKRAVQATATATMATNVNLYNSKAKTEHSTNVSKRSSKAAKKMVAEEVAAEELGIRIGASPEFVARGIPVNFVVRDSAFKK